jgi:hypothetical protein
MRKKITSSRSGLVNSYGNKRAAGRLCPESELLAWSDIGHDVSSKVTNHVGVPLKQREESNHIVRLDKL